MKRNETILGAVVLILVVAVALVLYKFPGLTPGKPSAGSTPKVDTSVVAPHTLVVHESVAGHTHTYSGSINLPSICDTLSTGIMAMPEGTNNMTVSIKISVLQTGGQGCAMGTTQNFSASFTPISSTTQVKLDSLTFNGTALPFTVTTTNAH